MIQLESNTAMKTLKEELKTLRQAYQVLAFKLNQSTVVSCEYYQINLISINDGFSDGNATTKNVTA